MNTGVFVGLTMFALAGSVHAKCLDANIQVSGLVSSTKGAPLEDVRVQIEWSEIGGSVDRVATATTDSKGRFRTTIGFYPWKKPKWWVGLYGCDAPPPLLKLRFEAKGYVTHNSTAQSKYEGTELQASLSAAE